MKFKSILLSSGAMVLAITSNYSALAQERTFVLEEVIVTAQKRAQSQQDVPIAITALSTDFLTNNDVHSLEDLAATVPGFVTTNSVNYGAAPLAIRGIGGANGGGNFFADEPVAVYTNGVYVGRLSVSTSDLLDIKSIEVLRGPQGTLYGRNSTSGAILIETARPTDDVEGYVRASAARFDEYRVQGAISGPLADDVLSGRLAIGYSDKKGYGTNSFDGSNIGGSEDFSARLSLRYTPDENFTLDIIGEYLDQEASPATIAIADLSNPLSASPFVERPDLEQVLNDREFAINDPNFFNAEHKNINVIAHWDLGSVALDSVTGYRKYDWDGAQDSDGTALSLFNNNGNGKNKQFSQEIRLSSNDEGPFSWIVGGFYFHEENDFFFEIRNINALFGLGTDATFEASQKVDAYAVFADVTWEINDIFSLIAGGRYSDENKDFKNDLTVLILNGGTLPPFFFGGATLPAGFVFSAPPAFADDASFTDFSPRIVLNAQVDENILAYASYSQGFTSGGFNVFGLAPDFESQSINAYEVGLKSDLLDQRLRINVSGFYYDYTNLQLRLPVPTGGVNIANAAEAKIKGVEFEMTALPTDGLRIMANFSLLDAEFKEGLIPAVPEGLNFPIGAPIPLSPQDITGNTLSRAPDFQAYVAADYTMSLGENSELNLQASLRYQSGVFFLETNQTQVTFTGDNFTEVDLRLVYRDLSNDFEIALFGQNIFDNRHVTQVTALGSFPNGALNEPAKWGIQVTKNF
ncbi:MAG: hypothetical protein COB49_08615 [Alphaproteobacteria bacterium]|nr:MAG: hypothetical protein COB49_08615 [Alphaproteobacteria bacterium]